MKALILLSFFNIGELQPAEPAEPPKGPVQTDKKCLSCHETIPKTPETPNKLTPGQRHIIIYPTIEPFEDLFKKTPTKKKSNENK